MKLFQITMAFIFIITSTLFSATLTNQIKSHDFMVKSYSKSLESENAGVRNSALLQIVKLNLLYPNKQNSAFIKKLNGMGANDPQLWIRMNARLAALILKNPTLTEIVSPVGYVDANKYFSDLFLKMSGTTIAMVK